MSKEKKTKKAVGRPTQYREEIAEVICTRLSDGESLRGICSDEGMPSASSVYLWIKENKEFSEQYARAREMQAEGLLDDLIEIADMAEPEAGAVAQAKLRIDARKWFITKVAPKKYGDKVTQDHTSSDGSMTPARFEFVVVDKANADQDS